MKRSLLENLKSMAMLRGSNGESFTPSGGPLMDGAQVRGWGMDQAADQRFNEAIQATQNPNALNMHADPIPTQWDIMGQVIKGRRNAVNDAGGDFNLEQSANDPYRMNTRTDPRQTAVQTGHTLAEDQAGYQEELNHTARPTRSILEHLQRKFGLL